MTFIIHLYLEFFLYVRLSNNTADLSQLARKANTNGKKQNESYKFKERSKKWQFKQINKFDSKCLNTADEDAEAQQVGRQFHNDTQLSLNDDRCELVLAIGP